MSRVSVRGRGSLFSRCPRADESLFSVPFFGMLRDGTFRLDPDRAPACANRADSGESARFAYELSAGGPPDQAVRASAGAGASLIPSSPLSSEVRSRSLVSRAQAMATTVSSAAAITYRAMGVDES